MSETTQHKSTSDAAFRSAVARWINDNGEVLAVIRFAGGAGSRSFEFFTSNDAFIKRTNELPPSASVTVLAELQLPIRGRVDDDFIPHACASIRDGDEWLIVTIDRIRIGAASWFHDYAGESISELSDELRDEYCYGKTVAVGPYPAWLEDSQTVLTAFTPNPDGTVTVGAY
ncbi:MAG: hypothetical protein AAF958_04610 [Planctomycetota bacterium]